MTRPRFTIRTLLAVVAVCAVGMMFFQLLPNTVSSSQLRMVHKGMTTDEVRSILGEPFLITRFNPRDLGAYDGNDQEHWWYADSWFMVKASKRPDVYFSNGRVFKVVISP